MMYTLRPWKYGDLEQLVKVANNPKIASNLTNRFEYPYSHECGKRFIDMATSSTPPFVLCIDIDGKASGGIGVHRQEDVMCKNMELGYWLAEDYWGQGIMTKAVIEMLSYAFKNWDVNRIYARPYGHNQASQHILEKVGFEKEGILQKAVFKNDEFLDLHIYGILREKWVEKSL